MPNSTNGVTKTGRRVNVATSTLSTHTSIPVEMRHQLNQALLNIDAPPRIEAVCRDELNRAGYIDKMQKRALHLFRSGQATTFAQARDILLAEVRGATKEVVKDGEHTGANGSDAASTAASSTAIFSGDKPMGPFPKAAYDATKAATRKEIEKVVDIVVDDE